MEFRLWRIYSGPNNHDYNFNDHIQADSLEDGVWSQVGSLELLRIAPYFIERPCFNKQASTNIISKLPVHIYPAYP